MFPQLATSRIRTCQPGACTRTPPQEIARCVYTHMEEHTPTVPCRMETHDPCRVSRAVPTVAVVPERVEAVRGDTEGGENARGKSGSIVPSQSMSECVSCFQTEQRDANGEEKNEAAGEGVPRAAITEVVMAEVDVCVQ